MSWIDGIIESRGGTISFRDFMELVLYHPESGFYSSARPRYGRTGDFITAPTASEWYGRVLADGIRRLAGRVGPVVFIDVASGDGSLVASLISALEPSTEQVAEWVSVESSVGMREVQRRRFSGVETPIGIVGSIDDVPAVHRPVVLHASELYDAMPVHRVVQRGDGLRELFVSVQGERRGWVERKAHRELERYFQNHGVELVDGQIAEVNARAHSFHRRLLESIGDNGLLLVLDYGYPAAKLYNPRGRIGGSLACYREHRLETDPLANPGQQDITAHVNWDDLRWAAEEEGWREIGLWPLAAFLVRAGLATIMEREALGMEAELDARTVVARQEIKRLLDPDGMGSDLKMLIQGRGALAGVADEIFGEHSDERLVEP